MSLDDEHAAFVRAWRKAGADSAIGCLDGPIGAYADRFRALTHATRQRAATIAPPCPALLDCLDARRPFNFIRTVDNVERVAIRAHWEAHTREAWAQDAIARYRHVQALASGQTAEVRIVDTHA